MKSFTDLACREFQARPKGFCNALQLMRHASSRSTLEIYSQARTTDKRAAQQRVVQMIYPEDLNREQSISERTEQPAVTFEWVN